MGPQEYTKEAVARDLAQAASALATAISDVDRCDRVDATDSIEIAQQKLRDCRLRLAASLAADPLKRNGWPE